MNQTQSHRFEIAGLVLAAIALVAGPFAASAHAAVGPDVTVYSVSGFSNYGAVGGIRAYALGTTSCNIGDVPVNWCDNGGGCSGHHEGGGCLADLSDLGGVRGDHRCSFGVR